MPAAPGRSRRPLLIVLILLSISILLDRYLITALCPWMPTFGGISLMVVFLDIPVALPLIDPLPVAVLFSLFYSMIPVRQTAGLKVDGQGMVDMQRGAGVHGGTGVQGGTGAQAGTGAQGVGLSSIWGGVFILACWMTAGALVYHFAEGFLSKQIRNGIDSFGIHIDIYTPFVEYSILPLRGGFILLVCFIIGGRTLVKRINRAAAIAHPVPAMIPPEAAPSWETARTRETARSRETAPSWETPPARGTGQTASWAGAMAAVAAGGAGAGAGGAEAGAGGAEAGAGVAAAMAAAGAGAGATKTPAKISMKIPEPVPVAVPVVKIPSPPPTLRPSRVSVVAPRRVEVIK